ncbi:MAG: transcriptional regulator [Rhodothermales bacterium]
MYESLTIPHGVNPLVFVPLLAETTQLHRLLRLTSWLKQGKPFNQQTAAAAFGVAVRTIANDLNQLKVAGIPVVYNRREGSYRVSEPFDDLPSFQIKGTEWAAFLVAQYALDALGNVPDAAHLKAVIQRLAAHLPPHVRVYADTLSGTIRIDDSHAPKGTARFLDPLRQAIDEQRVVRLRYYSNNSGSLKTMEVEPLLILRRDGPWYLVAHSREHDKRLTLRLDRIRALDVLTEVFHPEAGDLDAYLDETFAMHWDERPYTVQVRFSAYQARWIKEVEWHPSQVMLVHDDGRLDLTMTVTGLDDVCRWVMQYGSQAEVISPPILRNKVAREVRRMYEKYNTTDPA